MRDGERYNPYKLFHHITVIPDWLHQVEFKSEDGKMKKLSSMAKLLWGRLYRYYAIKGRCFPSEETLAKDLNTESHQIIKLLKSLEKAGLIEICRPNKPDRYNHINNEYHFLWTEKYNDKSIREDIILPGIEKIPEQVSKRYPNSNINSSKVLFSSFPSEKKPNNNSVCEDANTGSCSSPPPPLKRRIDTTPVQQLHPYRPIKEVLDIVLYWNSSPGLPRTKIPEGNGLPTEMFKKTCERIQSLIRGDFFTSIGKTDQDRKFTKTEIITVIDRFKIAATNLNYQPANKDKIKKTTLYVFIHNEYSNFPSYFLQFLDQEPVLLRHTAKPLEDPNPMYSQWLREAYEKWVLMGEKPKWDQTKLNQFIEGGIRMQKAFYKLAPRVLSTTDQPYIVELAVKALIKRFSACGVTPGHIASDWTYKVLLPQELTELGIIQKVVYPE